MGVVIADKGDVFIGGDVSDAVMSDLSSFFNAIWGIPSSREVKWNTFFDFNDIGIVIL